MKALNILTIASAGNTGDDVDREDCIGAACWEAGAEVPCEIQGVLCVGGVGWNSASRHASSCYGSNSSDPTDLATVRMFAPYQLFVENPIDAPGPQVRNGTSYSAPFVAGVAALVMAADPFMSGDDVQGLLVRTGNPSPDGTVPRIVNAFEAVKSALGGSVPPTLSMVLPLEAVDEPQDHQITFEARATSTTGQNISSQIVWSSDNAADAPLPQQPRWFANGGSNPLFALLPGTRRITAAITEGVWTDAATVDVTVREVPVTVTLWQPGADRDFLAGENVLLDGDSDYMGRPLRDSEVSWYVGSLTGRWLGNGHTMTVRAGDLCTALPCTLTILFYGSNGRTSDSEQAIITVHPTPTQPPPTVTITLPANNASFAGTFLGCTVGPLPHRPRYSISPVVQGSAVDFAGNAIPNADLVWHRDWTAGPTIATGSPATVTLFATDLNNNTPMTIPIHLVALDSQFATGSASVNITVQRPLFEPSCP